MSSSAGDGGGAVTPDPAGGEPGWPPPPPPSGQPPPYVADPGLPGYSGYPPGPAYPGQSQGSGGQQPGYGGQQPGYAGQPPAYGAQPPAYGAQPLPYGAAQQPYASPPPPYGGYPHQPQSYPGAGYDGGQATPGWSGLAIAAFVTGLIPWIGILAAIPLGIIALVKIGKTRQRGKVLAILGIVISVLIWVVTIVLIVVVAANQADRDSNGVITNGGLIDFQDIRTGDCVQIDGLGSGDEVSLFDIKGVPCTETHNAESAGQVAITGDAYPGFDAMTQQAQKPCASQAQSYVDPVKGSDLQPYLFAPNDNLWKSDDATHHVVCFVIKSDFSSLDGSVAK